jgi:hypothetical protein
MEMVPNTFQMVGDPFLEGSGFILQGIHSLSDALMEGRGFFKNIPAGLLHIAPYPLIGVTGCVLQVLRVMGGAVVAITPFKGNCGEGSNASGDHSKQDFGGRVGFHRMGLGMGISGVMWLIFDITDTILHSVTDFSGRRAGINGVLNLAGSLAERVFGLSGPAEAAVCYIGKDNDDHGQNGDQEIRVGCHDAMECLLGRPLEGRRIWRWRWQ